MPINRRNFINLSAITASTGILVATNACAGNTDIKEKTWRDNIQSLTADVKPITVEERLNRIAKAQKFMKENNVVAIILDSGTTMNYFTSIRWGQSERPLLVVIPVGGNVSYICPAFEEDRFRERIKMEGKVYPWQEDESPYAKVLQALSDSNIKSGKIGIEERVRFFIYDGIKRLAPQFDFVSADPISAKCRMIKSPNEIALMQKASDITVEAIKVGISQLKEGMSPVDVSSIIGEAHGLYGGSPDFGLVLFGEASALPHGTTKPQTLKKGDIVLMDCGCTVQGYCSDITRTVVFGAPPTPRQLEVWNLEQKSQAAGFAVAKNGNPCELVDQASRKVITDAGFGPDYKLPGLPHRTGHGIGLDGHEWGNMVRGNKEILEPGMCFSIEPTIAIPGEFGVRMEDCVYMTEQGPKWFSPTAVAIDKPFG